jgi:N-acetylneuraminate synthase
MEDNERLRHRPMVVLEVGCNHKGDLTIAKEMIRLAAEFCHADVVKFQKRNNCESLSLIQRNAPHSHPENSYGKTYGEHRDYLEFTIEQHAQLKDYCDKCKIIYASSVWDISSAKGIASLNPTYIKIPSAKNTDIEMLEWLCQYFSGEIQVSLGMTTRCEEDNIIDVFKRNNRLESLSLLACTSGYPVNSNDICLLEIERLKIKYGDIIKRIGFSGHHIGTAIDIAAYTLGAEIIERHFTLNKAWKGTDHSTSITSEEAQELVLDINSISEALSYKSNEILQIEDEQRKKLKYKE